MKIKITLLTLVLLMLIGLNSALAQVGIGTTDPKTTLQVEGDPSTTTTADGIQGPSLTLAQLEAKIAAYGADQDGAIVYIDDVTAGSTVTETANIKATGYYYYNATNNMWKAMAKEPTTYSVGDFAQGGIIFLVDETGQHGLVAAKMDQDGGDGIIWDNGDFFFTDTGARGDGVYAGEMNTMIIIANLPGNTNDYAAGICANYMVTEGGVTYGDWYLPSKEELNLMYQNKATIDATAEDNEGSAFAIATYWSSTERDINNAWRQNLLNGIQSYVFKNFAPRVRAVRAF